MTFDPERWLAVADVCRRVSPSADREAMLRTALNRSYYAALLSFKNRIEHVRGRRFFGKRRTHEAIYRALSSGGAVFEDSLRVLRGLRRLRERADYEMTAPPPGSSTTRKAVRESRWLIRARIKAVPDAEFRKLTLL